MRRYKKSNSNTKSGSTDSIEGVDSYSYLYDDDTASFTSEDKRKRSVRYRDDIVAEDNLSTGKPPRKKTIEIKPSDIKKVQEELIGRLSGQPKILQNFTTDFEQMYRERLRRSAEASAVVSAVASALASGRATPDSGIYKAPVDLSEVARRIEGMAHQRSDREKDIEDFLEYQEMNFAEEERRKMHAKEERRKMLAEEERRKMLADEERRKMLAEKEKRRMIAEEEKRKMSLEEKRKMYDEFGKKLPTGTKSEDKYGALVSHAQKRFSFQSVMCGGIVLLPNTSISQSDDIIIIGYSRCPFGKCGRFLRIPLRIMTECALLNSQQKNMLDQSNNTPDLNSRCVSTYCKSTETEIPFRVTTERALFNSQQINMLDQSNNTPDLNSRCVSTCCKSTETETYIGTDKMTEMNEPMIENQKYLPKLVLDWELVEELAPSDTERATLFKNLEKEIAELSDDLDKEKLMEKFRIECEEKLKLT